MNKTMEYMAFSTPDCRIRPAGDQSVGRRRRGLRRAERSGELRRAFWSICSTTSLDGVDGQARHGPGSKRSWPGHINGTQLRRRIRRTAGRLAGALERYRRRHAPPRADPMCGIAGCYQQPDGISLAKVMSERIAHRGPDAEGLHSFSDERVTVQLAHRRLSIIDLTSAADQPFSKDGLVLSYNGELYNYRETQSRARGLGGTFRHRVRHRSRARGLAAMGMASTDPLPGHVRFRTPRRERQVSCSSPATSSGSSRSICCGEMTGWCSRRS